MIIRNKSPKHPKCSKMPEKMHENKRERNAEES